MTPLDCIEGERWDEYTAFMCACKGEPYGPAEWEAEVNRLRSELGDAEERWEEARMHGACRPDRFVATPAGQERES